MDNKYSTNFRSSKDPILVILLLVVTVFFGVVFGSLIQDVFLRIFYDSSVSEVVSSRDTLSLIIVYGISSVCSFIIAPVLFAKFWVKLNFKELFIGKVNPKLMLLTIILVILVIPFNEFVIKWNVNIELPAFLSEIETQLKTWEARASDTTNILLDFKSPWVLLLVIAVVGFIPAVGEEFLFRGMIQRIVLKKSKNVGVSIFLVAVLFSAIHGQFYGFFPRLMLGLLLGLIYYWSGNLLYSIVFHFLNNSLVVTYFYLQNINVIKADTMGDHSLSYLTVIFSFMVTFISLLYFRRISVKGIINFN